jgi:hypothetical protein
MKHPSTIRLNLLRACYLLMFVGLALVVWPRILADAAELPLMTGVTNALLGALGLLCGLGIVAPARMLPLLVFEVVWKVIWCLSVALPLWVQGRFTAEAGDILFACLWAVPFLFIIPWRYVALSVWDPTIAHAQPQCG